MNNVLKNIGDAVIKIPQDVIDNLNKSMQAFRDAFAKAAPQIEKVELDLSHIDIESFKAFARLASITHEDVYVFKLLGQQDLVPSTEPDLYPVDNFRKHLLLIASMTLPSRECESQSITAKQSKTRIKALRRNGHGHSQHRAPVLRSRMQIPHTQYRNRRCGNKPNFNQGEK